MEKNEKNNPRQGDVRARDADRLVRNPIDQFTTLLAQLREFVGSETEKERTLRQEKRRALEDIQAELNRLLILYEPHLDEETRAVANDIGQHIRNLSAIIARNLER